MSSEGEPRHQIQLAGGQYSCSCGHQYPRIPMWIMLKGAKATEKWLRPLIDEHETT